MASKAIIGVVLVIMDGLRPDMVTADVMPNLAAFRTIATDFVHAKSVFPSVTSVAAASIATGELPVRHGVMGNEAFGAEISRGRVLDFSDYRILRGLDQSMSFGLIAVPTFADVLARANRSVAIVDGGASVASCLLNPRAAQNRDWTFSTSGRDATATLDAWDEVVRRHGFPPERELPRFDEVRYATDVFISEVIAGGPRDVGVLWLSEPDATTRYRELGSLESENTLRHVDRQLGRVLAAVDHRQGLERTLVIVASDHGQISATGQVDVAAEMRRAGFRAADRRDPGAAEVVVTGQGYGALHFTTEDEQRKRCLVDWLTEQSWIGHVFTKRAQTSEGEVVQGRFPGTLALGIAGLDHERAGDVMFTLASNGGLDRNGMPGRGGHNSVSSHSLGTHGGLNAAEMSTVLLVAGPGFGRGQINYAVAGIVDIAPTIAARFGLDLGPGIAGRDLGAVRSEQRRTIRIAAEAGQFRQSLIVGQAKGMRPEMDGADGS
jgi:phosphonoacetate hydrolase